MTKIKIGGIHKLNISSDVLDDPIDWVNQRSKKIFSSLKEINGKEVVVRVRTVTDSNRYIVVLLNLPQDTFHINKKYLVFIEEVVGEAPCGCNLNTLVNRGCQCGAFKKEQGKA